MKISFSSRLTAIDWIANYAEDEGQFEVLREFLNMNFIHTGKYFLELVEVPGEVVLL